MARAVLGPLLNDLRGKVGHVVFDNYKGVHIVRSMPAVITNPQSNCQVDTRAALAVFVEAWRNLTLAQKQPWNQLAAGFIRGTESDARMNRGGLISLPRGPFSGYNAFIACNMNRYTSGYSLLTDILEDAPITRPNPEPLKTFAVTKAGRELTASWEYITPGPLNERLTIWIRSVDAGVHSQISYTEARNANGNTVIDEVKRVSGLWVTLPNGVYQLQCQIINEYGLVSPPSELVFIQLGGADMFTYLAAVLQVLSVPAAVASIADTDLDLSASIPDGAHSAIIRASIVSDGAGVVAPGIFDVYKSVAQGTILRLSTVDDDLILVSDEGICPISTARHIRYAFVHPGGGGSFSLLIQLIGYIE